MRSTPFTPFTQRLGPHHFAHLRAVAEGIAVMESARRFLAIEHGHEAITAHRQTVDLVRTIARRHGDPAWRLIGVVIHTSEAGERPTLTDFVESRSLQDWSEAEQLEFYEAAYPLDASAQAKAQRRQRLRRKQLDVLRTLETHYAEQPQASDMVTGWYDERTAAKLIGAGYINLGQLQQAIRTGGRWYANLAGIGRAKAQRIAAHLLTLLPPPGSVMGCHFFSAATKLLQAPINGAMEVSDSAGSEEPISHSLQENSSALPSMLNASNDADAVRTWVQTHAGSAATVKSFWREARVFLLWLQLERNHLRFADVKVNDCLAFRAFLENIPPHWISRQRAQPGQLGWAPFRGPLSEASRHHLLNIVASLFAYLERADYLRQNPWPLIKTRAAMKKTAANTLDTRAFSAEAQTQIQTFIEQCPASPAQARMQFLVAFLASVGLRASELLNAQVQDVRHTAYGYALEVVGKANKRRVVGLPPIAVNAIEDYLHARGLGGIEEAPKHAPLLASAVDPMESISYQALYLTMRTWLGKAIDQAAIPELEKQSLRGASTHWLRHTFATRAIEREVPMEVVQAQLGHSSINTTMNVYAKASLQRQLSGIAEAFQKQK